MISAPINQSNGRSLRKVDKYKGKSTLFSLFDRFFKRRNDNLFFFLFYEFSFIKVLTSKLLMTEDSSKYIVKLTWFTMDVPVTYYNS